jgi:hypothetical protein
MDWNMHIELVKYLQPLLGYRKALVSSVEKGRLMD